MVIAMTGKGLVVMTMNDMVVIAGRKAILAVNMILFESLVVIVITIVIMKIDIRTVSVLYKVMLVKLGIFTMTIPTLSIRICSLKTGDMIVCQEMV